MQQMLLKLARYIEEKHFGKYRGFVADNKDPQKMGRVKLTIPSVLGDEVSDWALPCMPYGGLGGQGLFAVPDVDAQLWVEFEEGDVSRPVWVGTFWQQEGDVPQDAALEEPTTRLLQTASGHILQFDDVDDGQRIRIHHAGDAEIVFDPDGRITLTDAAGASLTLDADAGEIKLADANGNSMLMSSSGTTVEDANGGKVEMAAGGITVKGTKIVVDGTQVMLGGEGGEPVIKGQSFLSLFMTHIHPTAAPGAPTAPPVPQGEMSSLSMKVTSA